MTRDPFEDRLRQSLRRVDPPAGFAERVLQRVQDASVERRSPVLFSRPPLWLAAAVLVGLSVSVGLWQRERRIRAEGERAKAQLLQALEISSSKLNGVLKKVNATKEAS